MRAWNGRDANAIVALFAEGGTYSNPHAGQKLSGEAIGNYAEAVWAAFPDATFELVRVREIAPARSRMSGWRGAPTPGRSWTARPPRGAPSPSRATT